MEQIDRLLKWCSINYIAIEEVGNNQFLVPNFGEFLLIVDKGEYIVDKDCCLNLSTSELRIIEEGKITNLLFEFGRRFYYAPPKTFKDEYNDIKYKADFTDFKFVGSCTDTRINQPFVHLGVHTEYELLNGSHNPSLWAKKAKFLQHKSIALCDVNTMAGTLAMQLACQKEGIKSIMGMTATIAHDYDKEAYVQSTYQLKLYAKSKIGWQNLLQINRQINVEFNGFIPEEILFKYGSDVIAVICKESRFNFLINNVDRAFGWLHDYSTHFDDIYYQIDTVEFYDDKIDLKQLGNIKKYLNEYREFLKPVLINDSYYLDQEMSQLKEYLNKVDKKVYDYSDDQHFKTLNESYNILDSLFKDKAYLTELFEEMCNNTVVIADQCNYEIQVGSHKLPRYEFPGNKTNEELFFDLIEKGIAWKLSKKPNINEYMDRIAIECQVIVGANFIDYFLILWDIVYYAKSQGIYVGSGRGSVGGSLIAYLLDIITVDPVENDLLFERFLNAARVSGERAKAADSMPDVDLDFEAARREEIKDYVSRRFGEFHTCSIGSYGRLKLKSSIKDFARIKGLSFKHANIISKLIVEKSNITYTWKDFINFALKEPKLAEFMQNYSNIPHLMKFVLGQSKSASIHASAVIIVPKKDSEGNDVDIFNWMPIRKIDGKLVSEWEGKYTDRAGFLKEDILGLSQLDKFKRIIELIKQNNPTKKRLILENIKFDDTKTYELFHKGFNEDVFQFTSPGLKAYSKSVKPDNIEELTAMSALYRPGPMSSKAHIDFALIKQKKKKPSHDYMLQEITEKTGGLYIYQEQIMKAVVVLGGFSLVDSDILRTQIKKFDREGMAKGSEKFINGAIAKGCPPDEALKIWNKLVAFSGYGFNKSHSFAYSVMSYWSQWLKANFPLEFWTSALQFSDDKDIPKSISEIKRLKQGISVRPPDINYSGIIFECNKETQNIYWSLTKIKDVGAVAVAQIVIVRKNGPFKNYDDFIARVPKAKVNKRTVYNLILSGAFDEVENLSKESDRRVLLTKHLSRFKEKLPEEYSEEAAMKNYWWIFKQRELTGFGIIDYKQMLVKVGDRLCNKMAMLYVEAEKFFTLKDYTEVCICGKVVFKVERNSKRGEFLVLNIMSNDDLLRVCVWNDIYSENDEFFADCMGATIAITGKVKMDTWNEQNTLYSTDKTRIYEF